MNTSTQSYDYIVTLIKRKKIFLNSFVRNVLFVWGFSSHSRIFHSYGDVTITGERLQILTFTRHSWPLSIEGSLACHTYSDTGYPFILVISEDPSHSHQLPRVWQWSCHYTCFYDLGLSRLGFVHPTFRLRGEHS